MARIAIAGSGAIGGLAGFYMARAGEDVLFIDQNAEHVAAIRERGISVNGVYGPMSVPPQRACTPGEIPEPLDGLVFLACKSQATEAAVRAIAPHLGPSACVVSLQNGMNEDTIAGIVGRERTMGALPDYGGAYLDPGVLEAVHEGTVYVGELDGSLTPRVREAARLLGIGPNKCELLTDIVGRLWTKHVYNSQIVVTAPVNDTVVAVLGHKDVQRLGGHQVGDGPGGYKYVERASGIHWDLVYRRRQSEAAYLTVCTHAARYGVAVPLNAKIVSMIEQVEDGKRDLGWHNIAEATAYANEIGAALP